MARAVGRSIDFEKQHALVALLESWQASIGKAVLESWGFSEALCEAVSDQRDYERRRKHDPGLTDILIVAIVLSLPTAGPLLLQSLQSQDMYLAGAFVLLICVLTLVGSLVSDILLALADPRIRLE